MVDPIARGIWWREPVAGYVFISWYWHRSIDIPAHKYYSASSYTSPHSISNHPDVITKIPKTKSPLPLKCHQACTHQFHCWFLALCSRASQIVLINWAKRTCFSGDGKLSEGSYDFSIESRGTRCVMWARLLAPRAREACDLCHHRQKATCYQRDPPLWPQSPN